MTAQRFNTILGTTPGLRGLVEETQKLAAIQRAWEKSAPAALLPFCHVGSLQSGGLTVIANNGAVAAKLRQQTLRLAEKLRKWGVEVTSIQVEVQADATKTNAKHVKEIAIGERGVAELADLAASLEDSPLKLALQRLVAHQKGS